MASRGAGAAVAPRPFHIQDPMGEASRGALTLGGFGALVAGIQNTLTRQNPTFWGFFTRFGGTTAYFAATGASYAFVKGFSANLRETDDAWNAGYGGFVAGSLQGLRRVSFPAFFGWGAATAIALYTFDYAGGKWSGVPRDPTVDEMDRKEYLRKNRRRPIEETVTELGEGRGVYMPGYEDRRRQTLKEKYGIDLEGIPRSK